MNNVSIIGTGPAGLTAAIYTARAYLNPVVYTGIQHGGQLTTTSEIENFPGVDEGITGPELMNKVSAQAERFGARIEYDTVTRVDFSSAPLKIWLGDKLIESRTVIIATGAAARVLELPRLRELIGKGVSTCATCDGFFYKGRRVMIVGGGDSAMEEAQYLSKIADEVILAHRREEFRASKIMVGRVEKNPKVTIVRSAVPESLIEDETGLRGVKLKNVKTGEVTDWMVDGLFLAIGHAPNTAVFKDEIELDDKGYIKVHDHTLTSVKGVFAAGDVCDPNFRQAVTAAGMGCQAAIQAQRYIEELGLDE